jgi:hypothetical protein
VSLYRDAFYVVAYNRVGYRFEVRNRDDVIQQFYDREMAVATTPERKQEVGGIAERMRNGHEIILEQHISQDGKILILDKFFNARYNLYRELKEEKDDYLKMYERPALDESAAIRFTDQAMLGWLQALGNRDPIQTGLDKIVYRGIVTESTNKAILATMARSNNGFGENYENLVHFEKGDEGFAILMGTVHGKRTADMLAE